ncbi:CGNR zinc finger domain-containing protein [Rhizohabitans arisaemae]|uniref:CGNR zinc finger domain-containing protein n=1 Tax=Rhizohabitans arisaemae TaxID=2720610 RepID=UPI0024B10328|nr:CGNR zinc finger domain-containing protein [Rhizohabitans arisaemae]
MGPAELLRDFINTYDVEGDIDELASPAEFTLWLRERDLIREGDRTDEDDLADAITLREGLRNALRADGAVSPGHDAELGALLAVLPLRVGLGPIPTLEPLQSGARQGLARLAVAVVEARCDGSWPRLKVCGESGCLYAFVDSSKNRSRSWCSMRVCGNRTKTRAYRARRQSGAGSPG